MTKRRMNTICGALIALYFVALTWAASWDGEHTQTILAAATLPLVALFIVLYARDPWWRGWFGRSLMLLAVAVGLYCLAVILFRVHGFYPGRDYLLVYSSGGTLLAMLIRVLVLWGAQRADDSPERHRR